MKKSRIKQPHHFSLLHLLIVAVVGFGAGVVGYFASTAVLAHGGDTNLVHACVKTAGGNGNGNGNQQTNNAPNIRIVGENEECDTNETPLDWPKTTATGSGGGVTVVDSQDNEVGTLLGPGIVMINTGSYWVSARISENGFQKVPDIELAYPTLDCSGQAYIPAASFVRAGTIIGDTLYFGGDAVVPQAKSLRRFTPPSTYGACFTENVNGPYGPLQTYQLPSFTPPFSISAD